ncbi:MAG TPA: tRNA uracil 4-sulfurtransferase ThiI [Longimicrobiales bacterium]
MPSEQLALVRLASELTLKAQRTRSQFTRRLLGNMRDAFVSNGATAKIQSAWGRVYVTSSESALPVLSRIFGLSSYSIVDAVVPADFDTIIERGADVFAGLVRGKQFAVRAHRTGQHNFKSKEIEIALGNRLYEHAAGVNLTRPEVTAYVEVRDEKAYLFSSRMAAGGGLPVGVEGKALALISGGFDSAVAAWLMLKRGVALDYLFCNLGGDAYERAVVQVTKALADDWSYGTQPKLYVVDFDEPLRELRAHTRENYWQLILKRLMYRAASQVGHAIGAEAIITGEAIGQVSSQTLTNLRAIDSAATLPVFRPLLGFDKEEIIERARHIGTAALSEQVKEYCAIAPGHPVTAAREERVLAEENKMDLAVVDRALAGVKKLDVRQLSPIDLVAPYIFATDIWPDAVLIDCRTEHQFQAWHAPGAIHREEWELARDFKRLDRDRKYVLYCAHGIQSAHLAERMQRSGYEAYSFKGGVAALRKFIDAGGAHVTT